MTQNERRLIEVAKMLVERWVQANAARKAMEESRAHAAIHNSMSLAGSACLVAECNEAVAKASHAELDLIHAVIDCEREARRSSKTAELEGSA